MRGVVLWVLGASGAFLVTGAAFLLLANLGSNPATGDSIPRVEPSASSSQEPALVLYLPEDRLETLERRPGQRLALDVENAGSEELSGVDLTLDIISENTVQPHARHYQTALAGLAPGERTTIEFEIDLSPPIPPASREPLPGTEPQIREVLEVRAITLDGVSAVKTAILAP